MKPKDDKKLDAVIAATCRLASEQGLFGLTLTEIAKAAGIGTSTLYVYFADKEALFNEVYRRAKREAVDFYGHEIDPTAPLKGRVRSVWNKMLDHRLRRYDQVSFMEQFVGSSFMSEESRAYTARIGEGLMQLVSEGQDADLLKVVPAHFLTSLFIGSVRETARLIRAGSITDSEENRAVAFQLCWDGIRS
ncbi:TetR/AcrR family transcriptional regulator [Bradyrhizobium sp. GCM10027634]|uniref:TetR/AcrR family transcriptional regulator n=1 Tax=unclassified Bradyrhizobium TaxID=2631580 RepID=UPI00188CD507|nr:MULTISPECIES: TetR/AcrR family transcriptional regulator [unclassified Bradyrhizobium]MDN5004326.1 TetR/AcrR family transcriptional regulator [Bradyrhizobium sp. WYCCWR 12677]QOZ46991.1 TetR/AcrR family transcriptional regulator [Bradyrhizobium sp. CCBAU 53340]